MGEIVNANQLVDGDTVVIKTLYQLFGYTEPCSCRYKSNIRQ
jgi:hypothetical protein